MSELKADIPRLVVKKGSPTFLLTRDKKLIKVPNKSIDLKKAQKTELYDEQVIFSTTNNSDSSKGDYQSLVLKNQLNTLTNNNRMVATFITHDNQQVQKTSDKLIKLIGNNNYDNVFFALCSVISQELKVRAMLALLTEDTAENPEKSIEEPKRYLEHATQTTEICKDIFFKKKRRIKRNTTQTIVSNMKKASPNRVIIYPHSMDRSKKSVAKTQSLPILPDLNLDEDSNASVTSSSQLSVCSDVLNAEVRKLVSVTENSIIKTEKSDIEVTKSKKSETETFSDKFNPSVIVTLDGSRIEVPVKPEDQFHLATPEILKHITSEERKKLLWHQAYIDWKLCLETDEDGNMPLHVAVLHDDVDLIRRLCLVLRARGQHVDVTANGMTALEMSIKNDADPACTKTLLDCGASPLRCDSDERNALHQAARVKPGHMREILVSLAKRAREIIEESEELQRPGLLDSSDADLVQHLLLETSVLYDNEGYTPLILASKAGNSEVVALLASAAQQTVNTPMPNSGNTALYIAVAEACMDAVDCGNKSQVSENYMKTIETLIDHGADPEIENRAGVKVSDLLQEFNINSLSLMIAKKVTSKFFDGDTLSGPLNSDMFMLLKDPKGTVRLISKTESLKKVEKEMNSRRKQSSCNGQGDVKFRVQLTTPNNSVVSTSNARPVMAKKTVIMPKAKSFLDPGRKLPRLLPKPVKLNQPTVLRKISYIPGNGQALCNVNLSSQPKLVTANSVGVKSDKGNVSLTAQNVKPGTEVVKVKCQNVTLPVQYVTAGTEMANVNCANVILTTLNVQPGNELRVYPSPKRPASPTNVSLPEPSKTEKCQKRKSRLSSVENEIDDSKKLKTPEG